MIHNLFFLKLNHPNDSFGSHCHYCGIQKEIKLIHNPDLEHYNAFMSESFASQNNVTHRDIK